MTTVGEFDLIEFIRAQQNIVREDVLLGIGDDAALLRTPAGHALALCSDTLNEGIHFPVGTEPETIGWKSLAVNLSDLAAMGATPAWCLLSLCLPTAEPRWLERFARGFYEVASDHDVVLVGGDTTRGPLSISVTACGFVPDGLGLTRAGAQADDDIWVSGTLGDAALALRRRLASESVPSDLLDALERPVPRVMLGMSLRAFASSCIDISDGVLQDLSHICAASDVAGQVDAEALPTSVAFDSNAKAEERLHLLSSGDDYELCFTADPTYRDALDSLAYEMNIRLTRIGRCVAGHGVTLYVDGVAQEIAITGHAHF